MDIKAVDKLTFTLPPVTLAINDATVPAGSPLVVTDSSSSYAISTNNTTGKRITAALSANMPAGLTLTLTAAAPPGATSTGAVTLTTTANDVVTGLATTYGVEPLTYRLSATYEAGVITPTPVTVTITYL